MTESLRTVFLSIGLNRTCACIAAIVFLGAAQGSSQPVAFNGEVLFRYADSSATSVSVVGDFNGWSKDETPMRRTDSHMWEATVKVFSGIYQYKFVIDGTRYENDPHNPALVDNYNKSGKNSIFVLNDNTVILSDTPPRRTPNPRDEYPATPDRKTVFLNIIWHQHQPLYVNPETDQLSGPWVRTHATKDYYDMTAILEQYPDVHCNVNLTSSLLHQLTQYYVERLHPFVDVKKNRVDAEGFLKKWGGKTDTWIDLALKPTTDFTHTDKDHLYNNVWNAFGISEVMLARFPEYERLKKKRDAHSPTDNDVFTEQELRELKFWFYLAHFDPDFLNGPVALPDGSVCDLSDLVELKRSKYRMKKRITEFDCNRIVAEASKVMANVIPIHRKLRYDPGTLTGQIEVITTPYYHPILPLIYDSDLAAICQPNDTLPPRFSFPQDAEAQIARAVQMYGQIFDIEPTGMWPAEGAVAQPILGILARNGIRWAASDVKVLKRSRPMSMSNTSAFSFPADDDRMTMVFRDTELSDRIGFTYQNYQGEEAAEDFVQSILALAPKQDQADVLITVILDGENAWEWYRKDIDGKGFLHALYRKLSKLQRTRQVVTTTVMEYIEGNPKRGIDAHPPETLPAMEWLHPGSWINANFDTWIGEEEENKAWTYLLKARTDLEQSGLPQPDPRKPAPEPGTPAWYAYMAWESMYAAEGSDWFWWYGEDQSAPAGDEPFDVAFRTHLRNVYRFAAEAGVRMEMPRFEPILSSRVKAQSGQGTMAKSRELRRVLFECDARHINVPRAIYIAGNLPELGNWTPNVVAMRDDGREGDRIAGDGVWSLQVDVPVGAEIQYKYTNSGNQGEWSPSEEFPVRNRTVKLDEQIREPVIISDTFGE